MASTKRDLGKKLIGRQRNSNEEQSKQESQGRYKRLYEKWKQRHEDVKNLIHEETDHELRVVNGVDVLEK